MLDGLYGLVPYSVKILSAIATGGAKRKTSLTLENFKKMYKSLIRKKNKSFNYSSSGQNSATFS